MKPECMLQANEPSLDAVILVGHGSLRPGSGAAMIRLAARAGAAGVAPLVVAGFLNYSRPSFAEALARCIARGARNIVVSPYFLVPGKFAGVDLPRAVAASQMTNPGVQLTLARPFGAHPALAALALKRAASVAPACHGNAALLLIAHGSPHPDANQPVEHVAALAQAAGQYASVMVCYLDLNQPTIGAAIDTLVARGLSRIIAAPYFLQFGGHVAEDLPARLAAARARHPAATICLAEHLSYDPLLVAVIADRVAEAIAPMPNGAAVV